VVAPSIAAALVERGSPSKTENSPNVLFGP